MESKQLTDGPRPSRGIPLFAFLATCLILAVVGLAALGYSWYRTQGDKAKLERQVREMETRQLRTELDRKKADEDAKLAIARNRQNEAASQARNATNILGRLLQESEQAINAAANLKSNDAGRLVALHPDLVAQARRLYEIELPRLPARDDIINKLETTRRIDQQLASALGTTYEPDASLSTTAQGAALWAEQESQKTKQVQNLIAALIQESKVKTTSATLTANSPTLEEAVNLLAQTETAFRQRLMVEKTTSAEAAGAANIAAATATNIIEQAKIDAEKILREAKAKSDEFQNQMALQDASNKVETAKVNVAVQTKEDEAQKVELRKKASDPRLKAQLAPFLTPGVWRPKGLTVEKKPHSFVGLKSYGALEPSIEGLKKLYYVGSINADKYRPRWKLPKGTIYSWPKYPESREMVEGAQQLLIELGPVLVEMGLLDP